MQNLPVKLLGLIGLLGISLGCTRGTDSENSTIKFKTPAQIASIGQSKVTTLSSSGSPWSGEITSYSEVNCYAVFVGGQSNVAGMNENYCNDKDTGEELVRFGDYVGGVPAGDEIEIVVPNAGTQYITLIAMQANSGYCKDFHNNGLEHGQVTHPRLIDRQEIDLVGGEIEVVFAMPSDLSSHPQIDECQVSDINIDGGGNNLDDYLAHMFGEGRDGSITTPSAATFYLDYNTDQVATSLTYTQNPEGPDGTLKNLSAHRKVVGVDTDGRELTLNSSFASADFEPGDRVVIHVTSGWAATAPDTNACGGNLYRGLWEMHTIASTNAGTPSITLEDPISDNPGGIIAANLTAAKNHGVTHCNIQVMRVPQYDTINVTAGATLRFEGYPFNAASADFGGIAIVQVKELIVDGTLFVNTNGMGFTSSATGTAGISGIAGADTVATNGGAYDSTYAEGSGGGQAGRGADTSNSITGGQAIDYCGASVACLPFDDKKAFFGGAGGGNGTTAGGDGGGFSILMAEKISGTGFIFIEANGETTGNNNTGGGAGGAASLVNREITSNSVTIYVHAIGGDGMGIGGDAGGGSVDINHCSNLDAGATFSDSVINGSTTTTINTDAAPGLSAFIDFTTEDAFLCQ